MSRITLKIYGDNFDFDEKDDVKFDQAQKIKKDNNWSLENDADVFDEVQSESHGFREAVILLSNLLNKITVNKNLRNNEEAWEIVYAALDTLLNSDTLGEFEKRLLEDWWVLQLDKKNSSLKLPKKFDPIDNYYYQKEENIKVKKRNNKRK